MKLYVVYNGYMPLPKAVLADVNNEFDLTNPECYTKDIQKAPIPTYLIDTPEGWIMFDCGNTIHTPAIVEEDEKPLVCLEKMGLKPSDVKYMVLSHLHSDHSGYLKYFTESKVIVHEDELNMVKKLREEGKLAGVFIEPDVEDWFAAGLDWSPVSGVHEIEELVPGVELLKLGSGHSFGMLGLLVRLPETGNILIASDAIYCPANTGENAILPGILKDVDGYKATVKYLEKVAEENNAQIWYGHCKEQFEQLTKYNDGYYS